VNSIILGLSVDPLCNESWNWTIR